MESRQLRVLTNNWKECCSDDFLEAVGEIHQGNSIEAFYLFKNYVNMTDPTLNVDNLNKFKIYASILTEFESPEFNSVN